MADSVARVAKELGKPVRHFSYPYGDEGSAGSREFEIARDLGLETAVTTRKGVIRRAHADAMTALPRLSLNGDYQDSRYVKVLLSGLPFALSDGAKAMLRPLSGGLRGGASDAIKYPASASTR
jgi:peptidoglycan/xylan/chitin deacetylase (PgdA/CDA1 family)